MDVQKFTQKSIKTIGRAQNIAVENQNSQVEQEHVLIALLEGEDSLIKEIIKKFGNEELFEEEVKKKIQSKPKMIGGRTINSVYISHDVENILNGSQKIAEEMKDEYISVEHIMLSFFDNGNSDIEVLLKKYNINKNEFLNALLEVRGNIRVTSNNPESTYMEN
jgi:ATP-dependent Clp protease ATP-binding subunit ClpB